MHVISGERRGSFLLLPDGKIARPTAQRVKKTTFDSLPPGFIYGKCIWDCFAGSGSMGIEALSLGAAYAVFTENNIGVLNVLQKNIKKTNYENQSSALKIDFFKLQKVWFSHIPKIDIVFIDPPYQKYLIEDILEVLKNMKIYAFCIWETDRYDNDNFPYSILKYKKISGKHIVFFNNYA